MNARMQSRALGLAIALAFAVPAWSVAPVGKLAGEALLKGNPGFFPRYDLSDLPVPNDQLAVIKPRIDAGAPDFGTVAVNKPIDPRVSFHQPDPKGFPELFAFTDTCNSYLLRDGDAALLIDLGDGGVLGHLDTLGVKHIEWVLFTHHHREQCQGIGKVDRKVTHVAVPEGERELFEDPISFRKWFPKLNDKYSVYGASYARPPTHHRRQDIEGRRDLHLARLPNRVPVHPRAFTRRHDLPVASEEWGGGLYGWRHA
jgi:hypothetical protein